MANPLYDMLLARGEGSDAPFLIQSGPQPGGDPISHGAFHDLTGAMANALTELGLVPGDRMVTALPTSALYLGLVYGAVRAGVVVVPLDPAGDAAMAARVIADCTPALVVTEAGGGDDDSAPEAGAGAREAAAAAGVRCERLGPGGRLGAAATATGAAAAQEPMDREPDDPVALFYAPDGPLRGVIATQMNLLSTALTLSDLWRLWDSDVVLHALPGWARDGAFAAPGTMLEVGGAMILVPADDPEATMQALPQATVMMGRADPYARLIGTPGFAVQEGDGPRVFIACWDRVAEPDLAAFHDRTGQRILQAYGIAEAGIVASPPGEGERRAGSVGFPLPDVELRITDPADGKPLPDGETGVVELRGPNVFPGYWAQPEATAEVLRADGFLVTGDLGRIDEDGYVQIVGRV
ncbi:AMP-binding protein [Mesobaculum littorinae]|nr:AMP-binding protein [Mesobaculum littorinae]